MLSPKRTNPKEVIARLIELNARDKNAGDKITIEVIRMILNLCGESRYSEALAYTNVFLGVEEHGDLFWGIKDLVHIAYVFDKRVLSSGEKSIVSKFVELYKDLLGDDYEIIKVKQDSHHIPDLWLSHKNTRIPVEAKAQKFNAKALRQLQRYMFFYKCSRGIAVAPCLGVELPPNITFVKVCHN